MSLLVPHPIWSTCGSNPYEICKAVVQAKMLSGRYRSDRLLRHFTNTDGACSICDENVLGSLEHLLVSCKTLHETRTHLLQKLAKSSDYSENVKKLISENFKSNKNVVQLLLDGSVLPDVICVNQKEGPHILNQIFRFTRSWCYAMHKARLKLLGRWNK